MSKSFVATEEGGGDLPGLYEEHERRTARASQVLRQKGMEFAEFQKADAAANETWRRIREILGLAGKHWSA